MLSTIPKAFFGLILVLLILAWSIKVFQKGRTKFSLIQLLGSVFLFFVAVFHIFEEFHLFPFMQWGQPHSVGHFLDFFSALLGVSLLLLGLLLPLLFKHK